MARKKADHEENTLEVAAFEEATFEEALEQLETIVKRMEEGELTLDDALASFERGIALSRVCSKKLEQAEKRIDMVLCSEEGQIILKPADITEGGNE